MAGKKTTHPQPAEVPLAEQLESQRAKTAECFADLQRSHQHAAEMEKRARDLAEQNNSLRDSLMATTLEAERMRGYLAAQQDAQPPRMIPEHREPVFPGSGFAGPVNGYASTSYGRAERQWYHR